MGAFASYALVTAPAAEPLTFADVAAHGYISSDRNKALIENVFIPAARRYVEELCGLALITQTWSATFDAWEAKGLKLTRPHPVASLDGVKVWDGASLAAQDLAGFQLVTGRRPAVVFAADNSASAAPLRSRAGIELTFTAGFGDAGDAVPADIRLAMLQLCTHWHENREPTALNQSLSVVGSIKHQVDDLLRRWQPLRLA